MLRVIPGMLRRLRIGAVRAGRKLAVRVARSRIASVAAKVFASINRRRGLLLEGTLSQLRDRSNDHALFWVGAADAYPDDPAILRMQLHSALRAGDAATADAAPSVPHRFRSPSASRTSGAQRRASDHCDIGRVCWRIGLRRIIHCSGGKRVAVTGGRKKRLSLSGHLFEKVICGCGRSSSPSP